MSATILPFKAPAASDYSGNVGLVVNLTAVASGEARATLLVATDDGTLSNMPLGVIVSAEKGNGGTLGVCVHGPCYAIAGAAITPGTDVPLMVDGAGRVIPATDGNMIVGRFVGKQVHAAGDLVHIFVQPGNLENT